MKQGLIAALMLFSIAGFGQGISIEQWDEESKANIRLLPKYGHAVKTAGQKEADQEFMATALKQDTTPRKASNHLVQLGFKYLYRDIKTAMYRFNQAYLLDSTNTDIYWGFGGVYLTLGDYGRAAEQYKQGLRIDPGNTHLLTDYGTYFMAQYYGLKPVDPKGALANLDSALSYMNRSYQLDPSDPNTAFKLSACYFNKQECDNAWKYYDACRALGGQPITDAYTKDLEKACKRKKRK